MLKLNKTAPVATATNEINFVAFFQQEQAQNAQMLKMFNAPVKTETAFERVQRKINEQQAIEQAKMEEREKTETVTVRAQRVLQTDENGRVLQFRNRAVNVRNVTVFISTELNACWVSTHVKFAKLDYAGSIALLKKHTAKVLQCLHYATDVTIIAENECIAVGDELTQAKFEAYKKYENLGYNMLGACPKCNTYVS